MPADSHHPAGPYATSEAPELHGPDATAPDAAGPDLAGPNRAGPDLVGPDLVGHLPASPSDALPIPIEPASPRRGTASGRRVPWLWVALVAGLVLVIAGVATLFTILPARTGARIGDAPSPALADPSAPPAAEPEAGTARAAAPGGAAAPGSCVYRSDDAGGPDQRLVPVPPARPIRTGPVIATVQTNLGAITMELDATKAPCTVNALLSLINEDYYTETECHRLTTEGLWVLQCGDPTGTGGGTPGYRYDDENLPPAGALWTYPRGTVAIANAGPDTNGAQFFLVYQDSELGPDYPVAGRVTAGIELIDKIAAAGTDNGTSDGRPVQPVHIAQITVG